MKKGIRESLLAQIWGCQLIKKDVLLTSGGEKVEVVYPGEENRDSGPDFCDARIVIDNRLLRGDIELHVTSSNWQAHGHHKDPGYNGVILHVTMWDDAGEASLLHNGKRVPVLALHPYLSGSLEEVRHGLKPDEPCHQAVERCGKTTVVELLDKAGEERFHSKVERFRAGLATKEAGQVLYEGLMRALGYAKNKESFEELACLLPLWVVEEFASRGDILSLQALMLGTAGLLPGQRGRNCGDEPEVERLEQIWSSFGIKPGIHRSGWRFFRVRPENFPTRRIAAASYLLARYRGEGLLVGMLSLVNQSQVRRLEGSLIVTTSGYWAAHFDFGVRARWNYPVLLGRGRAREIVVNALLPFSFAWGEEVGQPWLKERAWELYSSYPRLGENRVTKNMEWRVLGKCEAKVNSAQQQQGLIHLIQRFFHHLCRLAQKTSSFFLYPRPHLLA